MKKSMLMWTVSLLAMAGVLSVSCSTKDDSYDEKGDYAGDREYYDPDSPAYDGIGGDGGDVGEGGGNQQVDPGEAGVLTAAEWNDLGHWGFWRKLEQGQTYATSMGVWQFNTSKRIAVRVKDAAGKPQVNVSVVLSAGGEKVWTARTDTKGEANLWLSLYKHEEGTLTLAVDGKAVNGEVIVSTGSEEETPVWNEYTLSVTAPAQKADIAFIVDATGSMMDEIDFLKKDLLSILTTVEEAQSDVVIRTGAVFYRDEGDDYVTRTNNFTEDFSETMSFIKKQSADGGGDLPEAVHTALAVALQKLSWNASARARIAFLILDAPAHSDNSSVISSLKESIRAFAAQGIRIIPVVASTWDKSTEFMSRYFAIVTGGTYVFLTDDSGVGDSHLEPTVGEYQVEKLNDLLVRLINAFID